MSTFSQLNEEYFLKIMIYRLILATAANLVDKKELYNDMFNNPVPLDSHKPVNLLLMFVLLKLLI